MRATDYSRRILALAELLHRWVGQLMKLDAVRREKVACYADEIAATLARAAEAHQKLEAEPDESIAEQNIQRGLAAGRQEFGPGVSLSAR